MREEDNIEFIDAETQYTFKQGVTPKEMTFQHIMKISSICTKEFKKGYWEERPIKVGESVFIHKTYKDDTREAYVNSVDFLHDWLMPRFDKEATNNIGLINIEMENERINTTNVEEWKDKRIVYRRKIFQELNLLLKRLNYLEGTSIR
jgi:hypothetical protein